MNEDIARTIKSNCVLSKLSDKPIVARAGHLKLIFVKGYPMTLLAFYALVSKAVFQTRANLTKKHWEKLNAELQLLCEGLDHGLEKDKEGKAVCKAIQNALEWTKKKAEDNRFIVLDWIESVEKDYVSLDQQPQSEA